RRFRSFQQPITRKRTIFRGGEHTLQILSQYSCLRSGFRTSEMSYGPPLQERLSHSTTDPGNVELYDRTPSQPFDAASQAKLTTETLFSASVLFPVVCPFSHWSPVAKRSGLFCPDSSVTGPATQPSRGRSGLPGALSRSSDLLRSRSRAPFRPGLDRRYLCQPCGDESRASRRRRAWRQSSFHSTWRLGGC